MGPLFDLPLLIQRRTYSVSVTAGKRGILNPLPELNMHVYFDPAEGEKPDWQNFHTLFQAPFWDFSCPELWAGGTLPKESLLSSSVCCLSNECDVGPSVLPSFPRLQTRNWSSSPSFLLQT